MANLTNDKCMNNYLLPNYLNYFLLFSAWRIDRTNNNFPRDSLSNQRPERTILREKNNWNWISTRTHTRTYARKTIDSNWKISARWISKLPSGRIDSSRSPWRDIVISMIPRNSTTVCRSPRVQRSPFLSIPLHLLRRCHCSGKTSRGTPIHQIPSFHRHRFSLAGDTTFRFSLFHSFDR